MSDESPQPTSDIRISGAERDQLIAILRGHTVEGRLTLEEFAEREGRSRRVSCRPSLRRTGQRSSSVDVEDQPLRSRRRGLRSTRRPPIRKLAPTKRSTDSPTISASDGLVRAASTAVPIQFEGLPKQASLSIQSAELAAASAPRRAVVAGRVKEGYGGRVHSPKKVRTAPRRRVRAWSPGGRPGSHHGEELASVRAELAPTDGGITTIALPGIPGTRR